MNKKRDYIISTFAWIALYTSFVYLFLIDLRLFTFLLLILVITFEQFFPHNRSWNKPDMQTFNNIIFNFSSTFTNLYTIALVLIITPIILSKMSWDFSIWPSELYFPIQVLIGLLYYDFIYYWYHRISHKNQWLWRLHRLHHSSEKLNTLALGKFNIIDIFLEIFIINVGLVLIQLPENVFFAAQSFMIPATILSHSNFDVKLPSWLKRIVITPTSHRIHHSINQLEHDSNYGGFSHFWEIVFKTYNPVVNMEPVQTGIAGHKMSPWIWSQFFDFLKKD